jgi:hypothetical protein
MKTNSATNGGGGGGKSNLNLHKMQIFEDEKEEDYDDHNKTPAQKKSGVIIEEDSQNKGPSPH